MNNEQNPTLCRLYSSCARARCNVAVMRLQADERLVSGDGLMLNLLTVMQQLSEKIRLDKIDLFYPHHPRSRLVLKDVTRLKSSSQQAADWQQQCCECRSTCRCCSCTRLWVISS